MAVVTIVGAGFMGSATAWPLTDNGHTVRLVGTHIDGEIIKSCKEKRYHPKLQREPPAGVRPYYAEEIAQMCNLGASTPPENLRAAVEAAHAATNQ